ncbi:LysR family transcriptional regulator [Zobellella endophytica]|uniref:LysR family transcriptional regulator n=1 Tax=Zobellella endophytica TaxID=2116700 RepID=A0A2P7R0Q5_9GAMM|nr:LysR family transcriptional regulator [Zobellella endophytica]PSJ43802.1 LysR family transcriptional regulator [Zobellella endophytica]
MQDLNDFYYYAAVVEHGGFAPAGRALGVPKSKLSRRVAMLEERLGARLLHRSSRHFSVTEVGRSFYQHCKAMLVEAEAAQESVALTQAEPRGVVRLTCPLGILYAHVATMLADFMQCYPQVSVHLEATNRRVDPVGEAIDVAIRVRPPPIENSDLVLRTFSDRAQCLLASPGLLARCGTPALPEELTTLPSLALSDPRELYAWELFGPDDAQVQLHHQPRLVTTDMMVLRTAALAGVGVVQLPVMMVSDHLASGALVRLLPRWQPRREIIHAVFPSRRGQLPSVRALLDHLARRFAELDED